MWKARSDRKITNDLAAQMRSLAGERDRNADLAAKMVTESLSLTAKEALEAGVVDVRHLRPGDASGLGDGRIVIVQGKDRQILLRMVEVTELPVSESLRLLELISMAGCGVPPSVGRESGCCLRSSLNGGFVLGVSGAVMVLLGAFGLRMLPFNWAGIVLLLAGHRGAGDRCARRGGGYFERLRRRSAPCGGTCALSRSRGELMRFSSEMMVGAVLALAVFFILAAGLWFVLFGKGATSGKGGARGCRRRCRSGSSYRKE
jgi:membrane-bound serine protease (ClpP class)